MSKVSTIHENMLTRIGAILTSHVRLSNPYKIEENPEILLKQGYGIAIGSANKIRGDLNNYRRFEREFTGSITRKFAAKENDGASKATTEKQILEDAFLVAKDFELDTTLNETAITTDFVSDGGIEYVAREKDNFLMVRATFAVQYFENLNA